MSRLDSLTGLRFFAALLVLGRHIDDVGPLHTDRNVLSAGMVGVSFFFILSGVVLGWSDRPGDTARLFWRRRFARIYPAYFVAWVIAFGRGIVFDHMPLGLGDVFSLTLTQAWAPSNTIYFAVSAVFWSLSAEAFFYLTYPVLFPALKRLHASWRPVVIIGLVAAVWLIAVLVDPLVEGSVPHWLLYFFPPTRLIEFAIGLLLALELRDGRWPRIPLLPATVLAVAGYVVAGMTPGAYERVAVTLLPFALVIVAAAQADLRGSRSFFRLRPVVLLGAWSYCFYLMHEQAVWVWTAVLKRFGIAIADTGTALAVVSVLAVVGIAVVLAWLLHRLVEVPGERRLRPRQATHPQLSVMTATDSVESLG